MKKILTLLVLLILVILTGCSKKEYKITLLEDAILSSYVEYENIHQVLKNDSFQFPSISNEVFIKEEYIDETTKVVYKRTLSQLTFIGWKDSEDNVVKDSISKVKKDQEFKPYYYIDNKEYTLELITYGASIDKTYEGNLDHYTLPLVNDINYKFEGWYQNELYKGNTIESILQSQLNDITTVYAKVAVSAEYVNKLINDIPDNLTIYDIANIELAYNTYAKLTYAEKQKIENYEKLTNSYSQLDKLNTAKEISEKLEEIYNLEPSASKKAELAEFIKTLNSTKQDIKILIPNLDYDKLQEVIVKVNELYNLYIEEAKVFNKEVAQIPIFQEQYYEEQINELYNSYADLDENLKSLITTKEKLDTLYNNLQEKKTQPVMYYYNTSITNNVYQSKQQLFTAFFTDFYYYIAAYHGLEYLQSNKLYDVDDFVTLAGDFYGAGASNLYGIGNIAGRYLLEKDINGILENQTENAFFGFCYQNNLYQDVLPFFINFFAFWRIDEKYANTSNYGADIFAESWAPTVDIAKFFYYDENTSYVKTGRMIDCLTNTAGVAYNLNFQSNSLPTPKLRGYIFEGWYDNPEFTGTKLTTISSGTTKVYAKWTIDQNQVNNDAADLVDVYIYNLTTRPAKVNATTVGYVKQMYENLTREGKQLVENYATLRELIAKYM